ncbi:MAG TPA: hypothetical protein VMC42_07150 [Methanoregulaceae archaeon]|nr:hypothetical protein [Methanoregulaceae archaeon]
MVFSIKTLEESRIVLLLAESRKLRQVNLDVMREMTTNDYSVILLSVTLPNMVIRRTYTAAGINLSQVHVVDAVTKYSGGPVDSADTQCHYISNPGNLTDIGIVITELLKTVPSQKKCLFFDDVSTMLLYSPSVTISKFIHFMTNKLRLYDVSGVLLAVEKGLDPALVTQLSTFADLVVQADEQATGN